MKTIYTDRYAVKVWFPAMLGLANLGFGLAARPVADARRRNWNNIPALGRIRTLPPSLQSSAARSRLTRRLMTDFHPKQTYSDTGLSLKNLNGLA